MRKRRRTGDEEERRDRGRGRGATTAADGETMKRIGGWERSSNRKRRGMWKDGRDRINGDGDDNEDEDAGEEYGEVEEQGDREKAGVDKDEG
jgi:hypothetical protein